MNTNIDTTTTKEGLHIGDPRLPDHAARITWLETEVARLARKVDATIQMGDADDTPTPKP